MNSTLDKGVIHISETNQAILDIVGHLKLIKEADKLEAYYISFVKILDILSSYYKIT